MFETDLDELTDTDLLAAAAEYAQLENRAAVRVLEAALSYADRNAVVSWTSDEPLPGYERLRVYGGDGCPEVAEFAPIEFGAVLGVSSGAASALIGEALALRHRLPKVWAAVLAGQAIAWRARKIAHACLSLSLEAAAIVDQRIVRIVNTVTPRRLTAITTAAIWEADPEQARAHAEAAAETRGVFVSQSDDHGTKRIWVRAAAGAVIRFDATIDDLAQALATLGDTDTLDQRRAKAIDWIADPAAAHQLIEVARYLARTHPTSTPTNPTAETPTPPTAAGCEAAWGDAARDAVRDAARDAASADGGRLEEPTGQESELLPLDKEQYSPGVETKVVPADDDLAVHSRLEASCIRNQRDTPTADAFTRQALAGTLAARLAAIKHDAHSGGLGAGSSRPNRHTLYVHLTDRTLATGIGVLRVEELGPQLASQLSELLGHDQIILKPVIDLHDQVSVHSYEIPDRIRERVGLRHPVDMFPYSGAEATARMDQDHIAPYHHTRPPTPTTQPAPVRPTPAASMRSASARSASARSASAVAWTAASSRPPGPTRPPTSPGSRGARPPGQTRSSDRTGPPDRSGPPGQTSVDNLIPQGRLHHRAKTFGGWRNRRLPSGAIEWTSPHGFCFVVDHTGTHQLPRR